MKKVELSTEQKEAENNLYIILLVIIISLSIYTAYENQINTFTTNKNIHIILRTVVIAFTQYSVVGMGITIVCILRKKSFFSYGLRKKGIIKTLLFSILVFIPNAIFYLKIGRFTDDLPFKTIDITREILANTFPINIIGMVIISIAWGFFEAFNYVVISENINIIYPSEKKWLNWGAITCAIICILIHGVIGINLENIIEGITIFILIYGILMIKELTKNAWGCVFIFVFLWNAF